MNAFINAIIVNNGTSKQYAQNEHSYNNTTPLTSLQIYNKP